MYIKNSTALTHGKERKRKEKKRERRISKSQKLDPIRTEPNRPDLDGKGGKLRVVVFRLSDLRILYSTPLCISVGICMCQVASGV